MTTRLSRVAVALLLVGVGCQNSVPVKTTVHEPMSAAPSSGYFVESCASSDEDFLDEQCEALSDYVRYWLLRNDMASGSLGHPIRLEIQDYRWVSDESRTASQLALGIFGALSHAAVGPNKLDVEMELGAEGDASSPRYSFRIALLGDARPEDYYRAIAEQLIETLEAAPNTTAESAAPATDHARP